MNNLMNWPVQKDWRCEFCGEDRWHLDWHFAHGTCFCRNCGAMYRMLDSDAAVYTRLTVPLSMLKPEYVEGAKKRWEETGISMLEWDDKVWASLKETP